jgi:uncharacterized protein DUF3800
MHLLYLDDSGSVQNKADRHIVLAGVAVFERIPHWFSRELDSIAKRVWPDDPDAIEFRASDMLTGRKHWRGVKRDTREQAYRDVLEILARSNQVRLFGAAIHRTACAPDDPMEFAFEHIANRFDRMLGRLHKAGNTQRGLIVLDESTYETSLQMLAINFRKAGHRWGALYNLSEVPLFVNSRASRMIQFADLVAHAIRRYYEKDDAQYFDIVAKKFDGDGGMMHGLVHYKLANADCNCLSCRQRG